MISKRLDILAITETWLSNNKSAPALADIVNTLQDFDFINLPRSTKAGGGVGVLLKKGFRVKHNSTSTTLFKSLEYLDLSISLSDNSSLRFVTVYRHPPSKRNKLTPQMFFDEFSHLLEISTDFNSRDAARFLDLLESAGLEQRVVGATHKRGHTLDLVIVRQNDTLLSGQPEIYNYSHSISDHSAILCSVDLPKPCATKKILQRRDIRRIVMDSWCEDIKNSALYGTSADYCTDPNIMVDQYNNVLSELIDKHAPIKTRSVTLRPHTP